MKILAILLLVVSLGLLGFNLYLGFFFKRPPIAETSERTSLNLTLPQRVMVQGTFDLGKFTVNLVNEPATEGTRFVQTQLTIEFIAPDITEMDAQKSALRDIVINTLAFKRIAEMDSLPEKIALKSELIQKFNRQLNSAIVRDIYFDSFIFP